ncbi:hypothetical protein DAPPUDRAFT_268823 [Daphnia pulex]|uniref:Uncharacterized protein n=1 Tax=Daphnia pulex TaxID=6669 RepID=E9HYF3_DAPPU|nr:hypothetical protein DAPPUDRAFT_268823 [Daphnia pulex]|eukprot:EFX63227.1 hypothetical protein DAPPUDRAFT_268823 [Daphnia pulex]
MMLNVGKKDVLTVLDVKAAVPVSVIELCGESITSSRFVRNLGATFDANLNMEKHATDICRRAFYHIHRIGLIRKYLDQSATARIISAFVLSLLDNGNSLLLGLLGKQLDRLQSVQNSAVRLINRTSRMEHITPPVGCTTLAADPTAVSRTHLDVLQRDINIDIGNPMDVGIVELGIHSTKFLLYHDMFSKGSDMNIRGAFCRNF